MVVLDVFENQPDHSNLCVVLSNLEFIIRKSKVSTNQFSYIISLFRLELGQLINYVSDQEKPLSQQNAWIPIIVAELSHLLDLHTSDLLAFPSSIYDLFLPQLAWSLVLAPLYEGRGASDEVARFVPPGSHTSLAWGDGSSSML